jgi:type II secretory pathway component PulJ
MRVHSHRPAYTLLEVLLATAIGAMLLVALYSALKITMRNAQAGRDKVEQATLARSLLLRIANDVTSNLQASVPTQGGNSSGSGSGGSGSGGSGQSGQSNSSQSGTSSSNSSNPVSGLSGTVVFNMGVQGDATHLFLFASRVPRELDPAWQGDAVPTVSDLRRITYWLSGLGLARQELKLATSDDAVNLSTDLPDDPALVVAEEVKSLTFQYFDGTNWQDSWDGTQPPASGGNNPQGPPQLIAITVGLAVPGTGDDSGEPKVKTYRHVIAIPTANGATQSQSGSGGSSTSP